MGHKEGAAKAAAKRIGVSVEEYLAHKNNSEKWCFKCTTWKPIRAFAKDRSRSDGYKAQCFDCVRVPPELHKPPSPSSFKGRTHSSYARRKMSEAQRGNNKRLGLPVPQLTIFHDTNNSLTTTQLVPAQLDKRGSVMATRLHQE